MTGQAAGLVLCAAIGVPAAALTFAEWRDRRREQKRDAYVLDRDGR